VAYWVPKTKKFKDAVGIENDSCSLLGLQKCPCEILSQKTTINAELNWKTIKRIYDDQFKTDDKAD
jgi:hypothetical protein